MPLFVLLMCKMGMCDCVARLLHISCNRTPRGGVYIFMILITSSGVDHLIKEQESLGLPKK